MGLGENLEVNLGFGKDFVVGLEVEIKGGEARALKDDEVFMFRNNQNKNKRKSQISVNMSSWRNDLTADK